MKRQRKNEPETILGKDEQGRLIVQRGKRIVWKITEEEFNAEPFGIRSRLTAKGKEDGDGKYATYWKK